MLFIKNNITINKIQNYTIEMAVGLGEDVTVV